ncbi:MAG: hypothetical protein ACLFQR_05215 [Desulfovibrionales bacterium]
MLKVETLALLILLAAPLYSGMEGADNDTNGTLPDTGFLEFLGSFGQEDGTFIDPVWVLDLGSPFEEVDDES